MAFLIGTDEAGYGPNLGPLVITATVWQVPDEQRGEDLYDLLRDVVRRAESPEDRPGLVIADSKRIYRPGSGLALLERGVLAALGTLGIRCATWGAVWRKLAPASQASLEAIPWYAGYDCAIPCELPAEDVDGTRQRLAEGLRAAGVALRQIRCAAIFPAQWNQLIDRQGSKGEILATQTLELLRQALEGLEASPVLVQCDKFGGRNRYSRFLQTTFPDYLVEVVHEGRARSVYRWGPQHQRVECRFAAKGEEFLPAALASMTSKYLRELAMAPFNQFWLRHLPGLQPTAGYPLDARRFKSQIADVQARLGIDDRSLWRRK